MIVVFGSINIDLVARVPALPRAGETVLSPSYAKVCGGKGANQAVAAARVSGLGRVAMVARIGDDAFGHTARDNLQANGVATELVATCAEPTACAFIAVDSRGENAITVASGANLFLEAKTVPDAMLHAGVTAVLQMEVPFEQSLDVARRVQATGGRVIWNFAPVLPGFAAQDVSSLIATTDILVVNEHEALAAAAALGCAATTYAEAGGYLSRKGCVCVVTAGAAGAVAFHPDGRHDAAAAEPIVPVDTTGAGDTFVGILASGLDEGLLFPQALQRACRGASLACLAIGAQSSMPGRDALDA